MGNVKSNFPPFLEKFRKQLINYKIPYKVIFIVLGIVSTIWFLIRVLPKPSRAGYPCMRAAAPFMSSFVIYIITLGGTVLAFKGAQKKLHQAKYLAATAFFFVSVISAVIYFIHDAKETYAAPIDGPNAPIGSPHGIMPGRVAWAFNLNATSASSNGTRNACDFTNESDNYYFLKKNNNQNVINKLMSSAVKATAENSNESNAWDAIFKDFNNRKGNGSVSYSPGEIIFIKINVGGFTCHNGVGPNVPTPGQGCFCDYFHDLRRINMLANNVMNTTPQSVYALIKSLVEKAGVSEDDIYVGDPMKNVYQDMYTYWKTDFPGIHVLGNRTIHSSVDDLATLGREPAVPSSSDLIFYSDKGAILGSTVKSDKLYDIFQSASYVINLASLKAHAMAGITLCAKNHFGSQTRNTAGHLHKSHVCANTNDNVDNGGYQKYRATVDLMGHELLGGNTLLFIVDGLYAGSEGWEDIAPAKWKMAPFNTDYPSSIFMSQDEIAVESVCFDFLRTEFASVSAFGKNRPNYNGVDDYLHQGADKTKWPATVGSTAFAGYDPEGNGTFIGSLGIHEHWNNSTSKQYSRNLDPINGKGIELVQVDTVYIPKNGINDISLDDNSKLNVNYPNPVQGSTTIPFTVGSQSNITIDIVNNKGQVVETIINKKLAEGDYVANWNAAAVGSGDYICRMTVKNQNGEKILTKQIQVIK